MEDRVRNFLTRLTGSGVLCAALSVSVFAQYGGTTGTSSTGGYTPPKGGYSSATGIGIGAGAAAGAALAYLIFHRSSVVGCVEFSGDRMKLTNEKDRKTYALVGGDVDVRPGERVELKGKRAKGDAGSPTFNVAKLAKDFGPCSGESARNGGSASH